MLRCLFARYNYFYSNPIRALAATLQLYFLVYFLSAFLSIYLILLKRSRTSLSSSSFIIDDKRYLKHAETVRVYQHNSSTDLLLYDLSAYSSTFEVCLAFTIQLTSTPARQYYLCEYDKPIQLALASLAKHTGADIIYVQHSEVIFTNQFWKNYPINIDHFLVRHGFMSSYLQRTYNIIPEAISVLPELWYQPSINSSHTGARLIIIGQPLDSFLKLPMFNSIDTVLKSVTTSIHDLLDRYPLSTLLYVKHPRENDEIVRLLPESAHVTTGFTSINLCSEDIVAGFYSSVLLELYLMNIKPVLLLDDYSNTIYDIINL